MRAGTHQPRIDERKVHLVSRSLAFLAGLSGGLHDAHTQLDGIRHGGEERNVDGGEV